MGKFLNRVFGISIVLFILFCLLDKSDQDKIVGKLGVIFNSIENNSPNNSLVNNDESQPIKKEKHYSKEVNTYFNEIALGSEFDGKSHNVFKRTEDVKIYVHGHKKDYLMTELDRIVGELNDIIETINIEIVSNKSEANTFIYLGDYKTFDKLYPQVSEELLVHNWGYFEIYRDYSLIYVDIFRTTKIDAQKHLLREELTQSLGLCNDSYRYPESIFYQGWTTTTEFSPIDVELIDKLYNS
jgi:hypothetical protein